ncbi:putative mandelamide amidase [Rosa chinensis]|uniref:Putative mandelamide amidase n=1 Tax=Rosa chinensis TaxID=74649 RepID=A0A2P6PJ20_ROSCH|nr:probable amidase At4g34880 isoform X5 [Rosa chinensis]PRQ21926.1 putative mandelamide amidase [Rosa chinensis]
MAIYFLLSSLLLICVLSYGSQKLTAKRLKITIEEATVDDLQLAFRLKTLTSREVVLFYLDKIRELNENLRGVIEVNPDALSQADIADKERRECNHTLPKLHGIPILLKDNIATKDKLNTTAGSFALLGSIVPRDAGVVSKLRRSGAIISGKASLSEWSNFRTSWAPNGWSARGSQGKNPYNSSVEVCGSSSGPAISVAANMVSVTLGTETDGSIICPASFNSVVGIKPTVGLTSRAGVIPISPRQDTVGPICRTVADSVHVLDIIVGIDRNDNATSEASKYIPVGGYGQFLKHNGLEGKRLGIVNMLFDSINHDVFLKQTFEQHFTTLRKQGAVLVDNLEIAHIEDVLDSHSSGEFDAMLAEFKIALNEYLGDLVKSPVKSLREVIEFNKNHSKVEKINEYGQDIFELAEKTNGMGPKEQEALSNLKRLSKQGFKKLMTDHSLDALVAYANSASSILAIGGFPGIVVPAGYHNTKKYPFGICFGGLRGSEPKLIEIAYAFEQATKIRRKPPLA